MAFLNNYVITFGMSYSVQSLTQVELTSAKVNHNLISPRTYKTCIILDTMSKKTDIPIFQWLKAKIETWLPELGIMLLATSGSILDINKSTNSFYSVYCILVLM